MYRSIYSDLLTWKHSPRRKPLVIRGARQVGKTWLMQEFAAKSYDDSVYVSFDKDADAIRLFDETKDPKVILERLGLIRGKAIHPEKTLIILDEIQECPNALGSLKYFNEETPEYHVITAGSLLGTYLAEPMSYPVGNVNLMSVYPLTFEEFLAATDVGMYQYYGSIKSGSDFVPAFHTRMIEHYRKYLIVGGMPECVQAWVSNADAEEVDVIQSELTTLYENDFTKHSGKVSSGRVLQVFRSIVPQLAKQNTEKFMYSAIAKSARAKDFEEAIEWLVSSGIAYRIVNVSRPEYPLKAYEKMNHFKLFMLDVGLIKSIAGLTNRSILLAEANQFKGALAENYVLEQLMPQPGQTPSYYAYAQEREIDFIIQHGEAVIPLEVKSGGNVASASLKGYIAKHSPEKAIRLSTNTFSSNGVIVDIPLYFAGKLRELASLG
jgi:predicted AAA+ superfamily ATPase